MQVRLAVLCLAALTGFGGVARARPILNETWTASALADVVLEQAQTMSDAGVDGDDATLVDFMYPRVVAAMGGRVAAIHSLRKDRVELEGKNYGLNAVRVVSATVPVQAGTELHSIVTSFQYMFGPDAVFRAKTYMIASSNDGGEHWKFVSVPQHNPEAIKAVFPVWNASLKIPKPPEPERVSTDFVIDGAAK